jgi:multiple sugar transport system ATP-binding protein
VRLNDGALIHCAVSAAAAKPGDRVTLGLRPEHITRVPGINRLTAQVTFVESLGSVTYAYCAFPGVQEDLTCELNGMVRVNAGDTLELGVEPERCYLFNAAGQAFKRTAVGHGAA